MAKKKIIAFGDSITYPPRDGISAHTIGTLLALKKSDLFDITLIMCRRSGKRLPQSITSKINVIEVSSKEYYDQGSIAIILQTLSPNILQAYSSYYARLVIFPYASAHKIPVVIEHHDIDSEHLKNYGQSCTQRWQKEATERASLNRTLSNIDADKLKHMVPRSAYKIVNLPTTIYPNSKKTINSLNNSRDVLFLGNCSYPPNLEAAEYIIAKLAPSMSDRQFHIIGRNSQLLNNSEKNVKTYGFLDKIEYIANLCSVGIAPLTKGSGLKIKVLTYLNLGLPVVGTATAFMGFTESKYLTLASLDDFNVALEDHYKKVVKMDKIEIRDYFENIYLNSRDIKKLCELYNNLIFDEHLTKRNIEEVQLSAQYVPFLYENRS